MSIDYHDPRAAPLGEAEPYLPRADFDRPQVIGLLANGFPDAEAFLFAMGDALAAHLPGAGLRHYNKHNASIPASPELVRTIADECTLALAAYGH